MSGYIGNIPVPQATQSREVFTATSGQTTFATVGYPVGFVDVWLNGVKLVAGTDFTATNGSDVVLTVGAATGDTVEVISNSTFEVNSQTFTGTTTLTGDLQATTATFSGAMTGTNLTLSGGVYLGGTGAANLLDDYEYGFFEPEFGGDVSDPTVTYDGTVGNEGWYVKVGRLVFIQINMRTDSVSGGSGAVVIRNLPFVTPNLSGQGGFSSFTIGYADNWGGERPIAGTISEGVTYINLSHRSAVDGNNITTNITDLGVGTNQNLIRLSGTYYTTA